MLTIQVEQSNQSLTSVLNQVRDANSAVLVNVMGEEFVVMPKKEWDSLQEILTRQCESFAQECDDAVADYQRGNVGARGLEATLRTLND